MPRDQQRVRWLPIWIGAVVGFALAGLIIPLALWPLLNALFP